MQELIRSYKVWKIYILVLVDMSCQFINIPSEGDYIDSLMSVQFLLNVLEINYKIPLSLYFL